MATTTVDTLQTGTISLGEGDNLIVTDTGTISVPTGSYPTDSAVQGDTIGTVSNAGVISGDLGIYVTGAITAVENIGGTITGIRNQAISAANGVIETLTNTGSISGAFGGIVIGGLGTLTNSGDIEGNVSNAIYDIGGGYIDNTGTIAGGQGIYLNEPGTIENAGSIDGGSYGAITLTDGTLILEAGYEITGSVTDNSNSGTLELSGTGAIGVASLGTQYTGFSTIVFDNADATAEGNAAGLASAQAIDGFVAGDTIRLDGVVASRGVYGAGELHLNDGAGTVLDIAGSFTSDDFTITNDGVDTTITVTCYYPGTRIRTPAGDVAVEALRIGDAVVTADGRALPVRWIGLNTVSTRFADPLRVLPIRIRAGALAEGLPERDLLVSPEHALLVDDILIQAGALVNGISITREADVPATFTYYHVELAEHALILAEGAPAESFVDNIHRSAFDNWAEHEALYGEAPIAEMGLPRAQSHRQVPLAIREALMARAASADPSHAAIQAA